MWVCVCVIVVYVVSLYVSINGCLFTYTVGRCRQKQLCYEHHRPWRCKPLLIQSRKCLPSDLQELPPAEKHKAWSTAKLCKGNYCLCALKAMSKALVSSKSLGAVIKEQLHWSGTLQLHILTQVFLHLQSFSQKKSFWSYFFLLSLFTWFLLWDV